MSTKYGAKLVQNPFGTMDLEMLRVYTPAYTYVIYIMEIHTFLCNLELFKKLIKSRLIRDSASEFPTRETHALHENPRARCKQARCFVHSLWIDQIAY